MDNSNIEVSVFCPTYNHIEYIRKALDGFVSQKTDFAYEIIVHDDASTDGTQNVLIEYKEKYPHLFVLLLEKENQFSKGNRLLRKYLHSARGKYITVCEGDDYWVDSFKLQKQYDVLESHPEVDACGTASLLRLQDGSFLEYDYYCGFKGIINAKRIIKDGASAIQTATIMYRRSIVCGEYPPYRRNYDIDYLQQIDGSLRGGMYYIPEITAVYLAYCHKDSWTSIVYSSEEKYKEMIGPLSDSLRQLDNCTDHKYTKLINRKIDEYEIQRIKQWKKYNEIVNSKSLREFFVMQGDKMVCREICNTPELLHKFSLLEKVIIILTARTRMVDRFMLVCSRSKKIIRKMCGGRL